MFRCGCAALKELTSPRATATRQNFGIIALQVAGQRTSIQRLIHALCTGQYLQGVIP